MLLHHIYINNALDEKKKGEVKAHETRHFNDFKALAAKLKTNLENAMKAKRDPQIDLRTKWFDYDN